MNDRRCDDVRMWCGCCRCFGVFSISVGDFSYDIRWVASFLVFFLSRVVFLGRGSHLDISLFWVNWYLDFDF